MGIVRMVSAFLMVGLVFFGNAISLYTGESWYGAAGITVAVPILLCLIFTMDADELT
jgi:hypothetical protein